MVEYVERAIAAAIAETAVEEHPYIKDPQRPDTYSQYNEGWADACDLIRGRISAMPPSTVVPTKCGKWIGEMTDIGGHTAMECSCCHKIRIIDAFCSACGAQMDLV